MHREALIVGLNLFFLEILTRLISFGINVQANFFEQNTTGFPKGIIANAIYPGSYRTKCTLPHVRNCKRVQLV